MDQTLAPIEPANLNVRQLQVIKVLQLMVDGYTQEDACGLAKINQRTYQRWVNKPEMRNALQQLASDAMTAALLQAVNAFPAAVAHQVMVATGKVGDPRDTTKAAIFLRDLALTLNGQMGGSKKPTVPGEGVPPDDGETSVTIRFTPKFAGQKVDVSTEVQQPPQVVEGTATQVEDEPLGGSE